MSGEENTPLQREAFLSDIPYGHARFLGLGGVDLFERYNETISDCSGLKQRAAELILEYKSQIIKNPDLDDREALKEVSESLFTKAGELNEQHKDIEVHEEVLEYLGYTYDLNNPDSKPEDRASFIERQKNIITYFMYMRETGVIITPILEDAHVFLASEEPAIKDCTILAKEITGTTLLTTIDNSRIQADWMINSNLRGSKITNSVITADFFRNNSFVNSTLSGTSIESRHPDHINFNGVSFRSDNKPRLVVNEEWQRGLASSVEGSYISIKSTLGEQLDLRYIDFDNIQDTVFPRSAIDIG